LGYSDTIFIKTLIYTMKCMKLDNLDLISQKTILYTHLFDKVRKAH